MYIVSGYVLDSVISSIESNILGIEYRFNDYLGLLLEYQYLINQFGDHGTGSTSLPGIGYRSNIVNNGVNILSLVFKIYF